MRYFLSVQILVVLFCLSSAVAQTDAETEAATIVLEQIEITDQPKLGLETILRLDLSNASPGRRVELALLAADYAVDQRRFDLVERYLGLAAGSWDSLSLPDRSMAQFLHLTLQQKAQGLTTPGDARRELLENFDAALTGLDRFEITPSSPWVCSHHLIGRAFGYWARQLVEHQLLLDEDVAAPLERLRRVAGREAVKWATTGVQSPTLAVSHGYLRELLEVQGNLEPEDPLYSSVDDEGHLAQVRDIASERGVGELVEAALGRLQAYRRLHEVRRLADQSWGRTYSQIEAAQVRSALIEAFELTRDQASLRLAAELFVTSFEAALSSVKPGWMEAARERFLEPPALVKDYPLLSARYLLARARFHLMDERPEAAVQDAETAVEVYQTWFQEAGFSDEGLTSIRIEAAKAYETLVEARLQSGDPEGAFTAAARYQVLEGLTVLASRGTEDVFEQASIERIGRSLKPDEALLLYFPGRLKLYSFLLTDQKLQAKQTEVSASVLRTKVLDYLRSIRRQQSVEAASRELYDTLFGPHDIEDLKTLHIAPSSFLANLPWGSLLDAEGEPLSASHSSLITLAFSDPTGSTGSVGPLTAIGNPDGTLPDAAREVRELALLIAPSKIAIGPQATREFVSTFSDGVMHFATHGLVNYRKPQSSFLMLAADDHFTAQEIARQVWSDANLVVLSACNTGTSSLDTIGHRSLAGAFLKAGAPYVLGTLWPVDDRATRMFMTEFYTAVNSGQTPEDSLRRAQAKLRDSPDYQHPVYWGGFVLFEV